MARVRSLDSVEAEVRQAQEAVVKAKARYEAALKKLEDAMARKDEVTARELLAAFKKSGKPYAVVMRYLKEGVRQ
jgi:hypothetical protein